MQDAAPISSPPIDEAAARRLYQRVVTGWALDALSLRRRGLDRPCVRGIGPGPVAPGMVLPAAVLERPLSAAERIRWGSRRDAA